MSAHHGAGELQRQTRLFCRPAARMLWNITTSGFDRLPAEGPAILCPNHISFFDSTLLMLTMPRNISFVGKAEYMDSWTTRYLFPAMGMIPIDRSGGARSTAALDAATDVLARGGLFGIYPEGTRSRTGDLHKGRTGAARLAMQVGCPIFPVGIVGTDTIQPPGSRFPQPGRSCSIEIGRPIRPEHHAGRRSGQLACRSMMDEVMFEVRELTGQRYVHHYAGRIPDEATGDVIGVPTTDDPVRRRDDHRLAAAAIGR